MCDRDAAKKAIDHYLQERKSSGRDRRIAVRAPRPQSQWSSYDRADLGRTYCYALGRAAARGYPGGTRCVLGRQGVPVVGDSAAANSCPTPLGAFGSDLASGTGLATASVAPMRIITGDDLGGTSIDALPSATDARLHGFPAARAMRQQELTSDIAGALARLLHRYRRSAVSVRRI